MDLTPSAYDGLKERASRLARRFSDLREAPDTISLFHRAMLRFPVGDLPSLADRDHFYRSWYRAMRSVIHDLYRSQERRPVQSLGELDTPEITPSPDEPEVREFASIVDATLGALADMDPVAARIVHLRHFDERRWQEIATELGLSYAAVQRKWTASKAWLRAELKKRAPSTSEESCDT